MQLTRFASCVSLLLPITGCANPSVRSLATGEPATQEIPAQLEGVWESDAWGQSWLEVDWDILRAELLHPRAAETAVQLDCDELDLAPIVAIPGACAVPGTPEPDALIREGRLDEVIWATGFLEPQSMPIAVHHATPAEGGLLPAAVSVQGTTTWAAVACPSGFTETLAWSRGTDHLVETLREEPLYEGTPERTTGRTAQQGLGLERRSLTLRADEHGVTWTGEVRRSWTETRAHWVLPTGLIGDAGALTLAHEDWAPAERSICTEG